MKPLLVFAMQEESQDVFGDYDTLHTGVGKVNAAFALTRSIHRQRPGIVVNLGTAGSRRHKGGTIVNPDRFVQRDMDVTALGFEKFKTPFSEDPVVIGHGNRVDGLPGGLCGTGDSFDASEGASAFDVVDMEAYALALVCRREDIPFLCLKYVSDGADGDAHADWHEALRHTAGRLREALKGSGL